MEMFTCARSLEHPNFSSVQQETELYIVSIAEHQQRQHSHAELTPSSTTHSLQSPLKFVLCSYIISECYS